MILWRPGLLVAQGNHRRGRRPAAKPVRRAAFSVPQAVLPGVVARRATNRSEGTTVAAAVHDHKLQMLPGLRLDEQDLTSAATGVRVVGPRDLVDGPGPARRIDPLVLAARYPTSRLTERGDVVFCTTPRPAAWVDREGGSVVAFPAKVLRCRDNRLVPAVVAADINAQPESAKAWRAWPLRYVPEDQASALARATDEHCTTPGLPGRPHRHT